MFLLTKDDIIISDPEAEYFPLVNRLGGQVIKLSPTSSQYINPMDINVDYSDEDVYCKGRLYHATKKQGKRLICSDLMRFCGKGVVFTGQAARPAAANIIPQERAVRNGGSFLFADCEKILPAQEQYLYVCAVIKCAAKEFLRIFQNMFRKCRRFSPIDRVVCYQFFFE